MVKPLFGYRTCDNKVSVDKDAATIVRAVLATTNPAMIVPRVRELLKIQHRTCSRWATKSLIARIRKHKLRYCIGKARADLKGSPELSIVRGDSGGGVW